MKIDILDLLADDLFGIQRALLAPAIEENFEVMVEEVIVAVTRRLERACQLRILGF